MYERFATTALALALAAPTFAQVKVGSDAPDVRVEGQLNCPPFTSTGALKGAALLLEFWATW